MGRFEQISVQSRAAKTENSDRFSTQSTFKVTADGFIAAINQAALSSSIKGLPIELVFPENERDFLEIRGADEDAIVDLNSLVPLLSSYMDRKILSAIEDISESIKVPKFSIRAASELSNISIVNVTILSTKPFLVLGKVSVRNATLEMSENRNSFRATIEICGEQLPVTMLKDANKYLTLEAVRDVKQENKSISIDGFMSCVEEREERRPDTKFMRMNKSSLEFWLYFFKIQFSLRPKLKLASIAILVGLPRGWNILRGASTPTELQDSKLSVNVAVLPGPRYTELKAQLFATALIGQPAFIVFPFVVEIPTKVEALYLSLQAEKTIKSDFVNISKLGLSSGFPFFLRTILTDFVVTKLKLRIPFNLTGHFSLTELQIEIPSTTKWKFPFFYIGSMTVFYTFDRTQVTGAITIANFSLPCQIAWPPSNQGQIIELSKRMDLSGVLPFISSVYSAFFGSASETLQEALTGLRRTKLSIVSGFSLEKALFLLSSDLSFTKVTFVTALPKYSWDLLDDFFAVENVSFLIDINIESSFIMSVRGRVVLEGGSAHIPFEMAVPLSQNQNLTIRLPEHESSRIPFQQLTGILTAAVKSKFPTMLGPFLPELILQRLEISFDEKLTTFEITEFDAVCSTSWDLGGIGALVVSNVTAVMTTRSFSLRGVLSIGVSNLHLELGSSSNVYLFRLLNPVKVFKLQRLVKDALEKMIPQITNVPDANLLDLNMIDASVIKLAEVQLSKDLKSLHSFALEVQISNAWSFFKSCCSIASSTMSLRVKDLNDIPSYSLGITSNLELSDNEQHLVLPIACNIPDSVRSVIVLRLRSAVIFNLSKITVLPMVGKLIPSDLLSPISDFIGEVRMWPLEAHFKPLSARIIALNLTATALKQWNLEGFPLTFQNITVHLNVKESIQASLFGMFYLKDHPYSISVFT